MKDSRWEELFVYGTLLDPRVQQRVIGRIVSGVADRLEGYVKATVDLGGSVYPIAVPDPAGTIEGMRLSLTPEELARTDEYEGPDYQRVRRRLASGRTAWVYVAPGG